MPASVDPSALAAALSRVEGAGAGRPMVADMLQHLVDACVSLFPVAGGGLMLADDHGDLHYVVASDQAARALEQAQLDTGVGPCVDAYVSDAVVVTDDVQAGDRWPALREPLRDSGVRAVIGIPVHVSGICVASLDVYQTGVGVWDRTEVAVLTRFAQVIEVMLAAAVAADTSDVLAGQLSYALKHRIPVERGIGYVMARDRVDAVAAFNLLRSSARRQRRTVVDVAHELLDSGVLTDHAEPDPTRTQDGATRP